MGVYVYAKSIAWPKGSHVVTDNGSLDPPLPDSKDVIKQLSEKNNSDTQMKNVGDKKKGGEDDASKPGVSTAAARTGAQYGVTTVSSFNCIHLSCHRQAAVADRNHPKAPKDEWTGT